MSNRTATRVLEDAGDIIRDVNLVDVSASETLAGSEHAADAQVLWTPAMGGIYPYYRLFVKTRHGTAGGHVNNHQLETVLGKLNRVYPQSVVASAKTINTALGSAPANTVSLTDALEYTLQRWADEYTWLTWASPLPALSVKTSAGIITPMIEALALRQPVSGGKRSARQWLDEFLSLFTGYVLRVGATGDLMIVAPPNPNHSLNLTAAKIISIEQSTKFDDIVNRATVQSSVWAHESAEFTQPVTFSATSDYPAALAYVGAGTQPPFFPTRTGFEHLGTLTEGGPMQSHVLTVHPDVISSLANTLFFDIRTDTYHRHWDDDIEAPTVEQRPNENIGFFQEIHITESADTGATTLKVAPLEQILLNGAELLFPNANHTGVNTVTVNGNHARNSTTLSVNATGFDIDKDTVILHSRVQSTNLLEIVGQDLLSVSGAPGELQYTLRAFRTPSGGIRVEWVPLIVLSNRDPGDPEINFEYGVRVVLRVFTYNWVQTNNRISATFGRADDAGQVGDLPGFVDSQTDYGLVERTLNANFINLDVDDALAIAQAYVAANMNPRERVTLELTPDIPVKPSDINKLVHVVPLGETILVESWEHNEMFNNTTAALTTRVTGVLTE